MAAPQREIVTAHSPDSDDAFMFYGLATKKIRSGTVTLRHVLEDIESLNRKAVEGQYDLTAISYHAYPHVAAKYVLMASGSSIGDGYGPMLVSLKPMEPEEIRGKRIAIPGKLTSAYLALRLFEPDFEPVVTPFDQIEEAVMRGDVDVGLLIHEGQLTYADNGLHLIQDLGEWWFGETGLPLPLGGNVVRKDLGESMTKKISRHLHDSIAYGLHHRTAALDHSMQYARGLERDKADEFVGMYVNDWTLDYGDRGRQAVR